MLVGGLVVHFGLEKPALEVAQARIEHYEQSHTALRERVDLLQRQTVEMEGRLLVEEGARRSLETVLRKSQAELGKANDTIAFYEQLNPPGPAGAVTIRALDIEPTGPHLKYRVLLMRSGANGQVFEGSLQFLATGHVNGEEVRVVLQPATASNASPATAAPGSEDASMAQSDASSAGSAEEGEKDRNGVTNAALEIRFADFQRTSGLLGLPEGFLPEKITLNVLEGQTVRVTQDVALTQPLDDAAD